MNFLRQCVFILAFAVSAAGAASQDAVVARVRQELAAILKKEANALAVDKPVLSFGADELDVVEWVMAVEDALKVRIPDDSIADPTTMKTLPGLTINDMAKAVLQARKAKKKS